MTLVNAGEDRGGQSGGYCGGLKSSRIVEIGKGGRNGTRSGGGRRWSHKGNKNGVGGKRRKGCRRIEPVIPVPLGHELRKPLAIRNKPCFQRFQGKRRALEDLGNRTIKLSKPTNEENNSGRHGGSEVCAWGDAGIKLKKVKGRGKRAIPKRRKFPRNASGMLRVEIERKQLDF